MIVSTSESVDRLDPTQVAMAALCEAGRPDLAARVTTNRAGWPSMRHADADRDVIARAFHLAHLSAGHDCRLERVTQLDGSRPLGITCAECAVSYVRPR